MRIDWPFRVWLDEAARANYTPAVATSPQCHHLATRKNVERGHFSIFVAVPTKDGSHAIGSIGGTTVYQMKLSYSAWWTTTIHPVTCLLQWLLLWCCQSHQFVVSKWGHPNTSQSFPGFYIYDPHILTVAIAKCGNIHKVGPPGYKLVYCSSYKVYI